MSSRQLADWHRWDGSFVRHQAHRLTWSISSQAWIYQDCTIVKHMVWQEYWVANCLLIRRLERASTAASRCACCHYQCLAFIYRRDAEHHLCRRHCRCESGLVRSATLIPWTSSTEMHQILVRQNSLTNLTHGNYGGQWTFYSIMAAWQLTLPLMSNRLTISLLRRSLWCSPTPAAHLHRYFMVRDLTWRFGPFHHWPPMTSSTPFDDFRTNFWQLIRYRLQSSSRSLMWLRHSSLRSSTDRWLSAIFLLGSRRRISTIFLLGSRRRFSPYREEARARHHRRLLVSTDFESVVLSKLLESLVARQLRDYLTSADLVPPLKSGFQPGHSTETAVL